MNANFGNGVFNSTLIETDLEGNLVNNGEMPFWLRDIIERAFSSSGIRVQRKVASKDAIASLQDADITELSGETCPICYDKYMPGRHKKMKLSSSDQKVNLSGPEKALDKLAKQLSTFGVGISRATDARMFGDPSLLLPVDCAATHHARFPIASIQTRAPVTQKEMFPALISDSSEPLDVSKCEHTPVSMPNCGHVFGKPCIIEWLNGHVSCPLCRKEVEALRDNDPFSKRVATIRQNCNFMFGADTEELVNHLAKNSTDVFNPLRKTMKPSVTPLTDTSIPQSWATLAKPFETPVGTMIESMDPPLVMTRKFPLTHFGSEPSAIPFGSLLNSPPLYRPVQQNVESNFTLNNSEATLNRDADGT